MLKQRAYQKKKKKKSHFIFRRSARIGVKYFTQVLKISPLKKNF
jgi:hypothetical protein